MADTNYVISMVKILEKPVQKVLNEKISVTKFRAQLPQIRNNRIITVIFWSNLSINIGNSYQINDYIVIEGYLSIKKNGSNKLMKSNSLEIILTGTKIYFYKLD